MCPWKVLTALVVAASYVPVTPIPAKRFSLTRRWTTLTASPVLPGPSETTSFSQTEGQTMPDTSVPWAAWNALTWSTVVWP